MKTLLNVLVVAGMIIAFGLYALATVIMLVSGLISGNTSLILGGILLFILYLYLLSSIEKSFKNGRFI
ncbi:MAG TPA: hypothetical protein PLP33_19630 [Leptospiraceae bacterium]|nr:hypothetical protein [Leptospiraceae bacterium]